jgi:MoaA/NifB/PqqE/SkfB family radical SAM enzyme
MTKKCRVHGIMHSIVETDKELYHSMNYVNRAGNGSRGDSILFEITDRCNLKCPHCYHLPDNSVEDSSFDEIMRRTSFIPKNCIPIFAGAEPTMRRDFCDVVSAVTSRYSHTCVLSNGVKFHSKEFTKQVYRAGLRDVIFGMNHWSYQGKTIHQKQLVAVNNLLEQDFSIPYLGYTLESLDHVEDILNEIDEIHDYRISQYRIRCGSFIGRSSDKKRNYVSDTICKIKSILGDDIITDPDADNNIYHYNMLWKNRKIRVIQWPDVHNINMEELNCEPYCYFYDGPITNFVHQVITRDAYINMGVHALDRVPSRYRYYQGPRPYWKDNWQGITKLDHFDWSYHSLDMLPQEILNE